MAFQLARRIQIMVLMMPAWPESGFGNEPPGWAMGRQLAGRRDVSWRGGLGRQRWAAAGRGRLDGMSTVGGRGWGRRREGYAGRWEVKLDNIAALAAEREQLARTPEGGSRGGGFGVAPG
jgi:hypothetical protein